jgi:hypothetical protein
MERGAGVRRARLIKALTAHFTSRRISQVSIRRWKNG